MSCCQEDTREVGGGRYEPPCKKGSCKGGRVEGISGAHIKTEIIFRSYWMWKTKVSCDFVLGCSGLLENYNMPCWEA